LALVGELLRDPEAALLTDHHGLQAVGPAGDDAVQPEGDRLAARHRAVEDVAVGRPAAVVHLHLAGRGRLLLAGPLLEHLVEDALLGLLAPRGPRGDALGHRRRLRHLLHRAPLAVVLPYTTLFRSLALVGELLRDPEAGLLADHHGLQALGPARDDRV